MRPKVGAVAAVTGDPESARLCARLLAALGERASGPTRLVLREDGEPPRLREGEPSVHIGVQAALGRSGEGRGAMRVAAYRDGAVALALDGALTSGGRIRSELMETGALFGADGDAEVILQAIAASDQRTLVNRLVDALGRLEGGYALVALDAHRVIGMRDPLGFRPLWLGRWDNATLLTSESSAIVAIGGEAIREVEPGEMVILEEGRIDAIRPFPRRARRACILEPLLLARPDSVIFDREAYASRLRMGEVLARQQPVRADVVLPYLEQANPIAIGYGRRVSVPMEPGLIREGERFSVIRSVVSDRRVVVVAAALLRAGPLQAVVRGLRMAGATEVHIRLASPPLSAPCLYGVELMRGSEEEWKDRGRNELAGLREFLECDTLGAMDAAGLREAIGDERGWCEGCFTREHPLVPQTTEKVTQVPLFGGLE